MKSSCGPCCDSMLVFEAGCQADHKSESAISISAT